MAEIIQNNVSSKNSPKKIPLRQTQWIYALIVLVVVILAAAAWLIYAHFKPAYTTYSLSSGQSGAGMSFERPAKDSTVLYNQTGQIELADETSSSTVSSVIAAAITPTSKAPYTSSQLKSLSTILSDTKNSLYIQYSEPLGEFVSSRFPASTPITYTPLAAFTNPYIKQNAWQMSLTATGRDSTGKATQLKGKMVYAVTDHGYYYFMVYAPAAKWTSNQTTWDHVISSVRVDR